MNIPSVKRDDLANDEEQRINVPTKAQEYDYESTYVSSKNISEKVIKKIESIVRGSNEYKDWVAYLKNELDMKKCPILPKLQADKYGVGIEIHHYPLTLYDITEAIARKMLNQPASLDSDKDAPENKESIFKIASAVMEEHYKSNVGVVPLTTTLHEMCHSRMYVLGIDEASGNHEEFIKKYGGYLSPEAFDRYNEIKEHSTNPDIQRRNEELLAKIVSEYR